MEIFALDHSRALAHAAGRSVDRAIVRYCIAIERRRGYAFLMQILQIVHYVGFKR